MDVVRAFIGDNRFQVKHMPDDVEFIGHAVSAVHFAGGTGDVQRLAGGVTLNHRDVLRRADAVVEHPADP